MSSSKTENIDDTVSGKVKSMWKNYGKLAIGTYFGIYVTTLGSIFLSLDLDLFNAATFGLDPVYAVKKVFIHI
jgi:hypothetical protein